MQGAETTRPPSLPDPSRSHVPHPSAVGLSVSFLLPSRRTEMLASARLWHSDADEHAGAPVPHLSTAVTHGDSLLVTLLVSFSPTYSLIT